MKVKTSILLLLMIATALPSFGGNGNGNGTDSLQATRYVTRATMYGVGYTNVFVDADKLTAALKKDASGVGALIVGDGKKTGITTTIGSNLTSWLSTTGIIKAATDGVSKTLNKLTKDYNAASDRIDAQVARYKEQFTQLDVLMTSLNSTSSYLTQQFENNSNSK